ncbi:hypothetical protein VNI00_018930 [Paramarasmius palmivorus]|uniref:Uncharacterized protein n=1 Tax=Paramarasmius palmivorus TaxID=297713 RepID=A0AAW0ASI1_9AGAR
MSTYNVGYDETGKGAGLCARHEMILPNGLGALQVGERYSNMDYIVASLLRHVPLLLLILMSYDIMCQWSKKLYHRFQQLPLLVRQILTRRVLKLAIPKLHILGHLLKCQEKFSLLYTEGAGETDAEGIERVWSGIGTVATSIKEMGPGSHHDTLEDHCSDWNWMKVIGLDRLLAKRLLNAVKQFKSQHESWLEFSQHQKQEAAEWIRAVHSFESGVSEDNPFSLPECGITLTSVRLDADNTTASEFVYFGIELEAKQLELQEDIKRTHAATPKQLTNLVNRRTKLLRQIKRLRTLQRKYSPISLQIFATLPPDKLSPNAEDVPLLLPSSFSDTQRQAPSCVPEVVDIERRLREGQLNESLNTLRHHLIVKQRLLRYKKRNARKQGVTTRSRNLVDRQQAKVHLAAATYRTAWSAMCSLLGKDKSEMKWRQLKEDHVRCMDELDPSEKAKRKVAKPKRAEAQRRENAGQERLPAGAGESVRIISWIWEGASHQSGNALTSEALHEGLRVEYCKSYARVRRWREEVLLLQEEMRRCLKTLQWQEDWWNARANMSSLTGPHRDGCSAYAYQQAAVKNKIAKRFVARWAKAKVKEARDFVPAISLTDIVPLSTTASMKRKRDVLSDNEDSDDNDDSDYQSPSEVESEDESGDESGEESGDESDDEGQDDEGLLNGETQDGISEEEDSDDDHGLSTLSLSDKLILLEEDLGS